MKVAGLALDCGSRGALIGTVVDSLDTRLPVLAMHRDSLARFIGWPTTAQQETAGSDASGKEARTRTRGITRRATPAGQG